MESRQNTLVYACQVVSLDVTHREILASNIFSESSTGAPLSLLMETATLICLKHWNWTLSFNSDTKYAREGQCFQQAYAFYGHL